MHLSHTVCRASAWKLSALALSLSTGFLSLSYAQTNDDKSLVPVVVTASRIEQLQTEAIPSTTVITAETIRNKQPQDVLTLLRNEVGIEISQSGGPGTAASVYLRGAKSTQFLLLLDGIPIRDSTSIGSGAPLENILPDQIERIEIVRGNVSAIYGSGAIGGVIQIFTKQGSGKPSVSFSAEAGSRGTTKVGAGVSGQSGDTRYMLSATRWSTDGFSAMNTVQFPGENPDDDGSRNVSFLGAISHQWSKGNELGIRAYAMDAKFDNDGGGFGSPIQEDRGTAKQKTFSLYSKNRITQDWLSTVTASQTEIRRFQESKTPGGSPFDYESHFKNDTSMLQWANELALSPDLILTAGGDIARDKADVRDSFSRSRTNYSLYTGLNAQHGAHSAQANLRYDHTDNSGSDTTGYLGYGYALTPSWKLIASASTAFLAPSMYQLYDTFSGNTSLKAERARSYEAGIQYANGSTIVRATAFDSRVRDQIDWVFPRYYNVDRVKNSGLELSAVSRYADIDWHANVTFQDPKDRETNETVFRRAKRFGSVGASKTIGAWYVGGDIQYAGPRTDLVSSQKVELGSYFVTNLNVRYNVNKELSFYSRLENAFDRDYQTVYGYNQAPRGIFVGLNWKPQ